MTPEHVVQLAWLVVVAMTAAVVWFVRLEGRVNLIERVVTDWIKERREALRDVVTHLERLEEKVDRINLRCAMASHFQTAAEAREDER